MTNMHTVDLLDAMRTYLIAQNIVRSPRVPGAAPPLWIAPRDGTPAPGEGSDATEKGSDAVLSIVRTGGIPGDSYESFLRKPTVDIRLRTRTAKIAYDIDMLLRDALHDKRAWDMAGLTVVESLQFRELQSLGSDAQSFDFVTEYVFELWA